MLLTTTVDDVDDGDGSLVSLVLLSFEGVIVVDDFDPSVVVDCGDSVPVADVFVSVVDDVGTTFVVGDVCDDSDGDGDWVVGGSDVGVRLVGGDGDGDGEGCGSVGGGAVGGSNGVGFGVCTG